MPQSLWSLRARPGKVVVGAGDTEIGFPAERLAQVMHRVREEPHAKTGPRIVPYRRGPPQKIARSTLRYRA